MPADKDASIEVLRERLDREIAHINDDLKDIKEQTKRNAFDISDIKIEAASIRTELRVFGGIIIAVLLMVLGLILQHFAG